MIRIVVLVTGVLVLAAVGFYLYSTWIHNPRIAREIVEDPDGERARKVMLITLPSGRKLPVNYLHEGDKVFAGADGRWWKELSQPTPVTVYVRGQELQGVGRAVLDDPAYTEDVFARLRPNAIEGFGTLIEVQVEALP